MIKTKIIKQKDLAVKQNLNIIKQALLSSKLVIFPTETVYGIGANALDPKAAKKIYKAKGRPSDNPLIVHISSKADVDKYVKSKSKVATKLINKFWPGPLTLIFKKNNLIPKTITGGLNTVAIRMPKNKTALSIIKHAGIPIAAPSANISGKPSSTKFAHVLNDFKNKVEIIVDGGDSLIGIESTVVDVSVNPPVLLRPGFITKSMIEQVLKIKIKDKSDIRVKSKVKSPGLKYKHYQPSGEVIILDGKIKKVAKYVNQLKLKSIAVICESEYKNLFKVKVRDLGSANKPESLAKNLYAALRDMDLWKIKHIYVHHLGDQELAYSLMNRLLKAANYKVIKL